ncbi:superoxide dismutase [Candidatus Gracilibacteria bacterium]|nr:superoxide dismutase [Candidatus Gracilibacteria bacterium]
MKHELIALPYSLDALEPVMSKETLEYHYGKHHQTYVNKLNELIVGTEFEDMPLEDIIKKSSGGIFNNAAQIWNHNLFWESFNPQSSPLDKTNSKLAIMIDQSFGSFEDFQVKFKAGALSRFGSGWTWLVQKGETLEIYSSPNAENPLTLGGEALLGLDVWEHSYYIDYRNDRGTFVDNFWKIVDWTKVEAKLK